MICAALLHRKRKVFPSFEICYEIIIHLKGWRSLSLTDFIDVFKTKMRVFLLIVLGCDIMLPLAILVNSLIVLRLRDQFICGIRNPSTSKKLLNEDRTFQDALKVAIVDEVGSKEILELRSDTTKPVDITMGKNRFPENYSNSRNTHNSNKPTPLSTFQKCHLQ